MGAIIIRICVIGCGDIAFAAHGPALSRLAGDGICKLAGCCARHIEKAELFRQRFGFEKAYSDYTRMLSEQKPDAVFVLMPVRLAADCAIDVMERGYPVIMEKPPGVSAEENDRIVEAAKRTGVFNAVTFNRRSMPLLLEAKKLLDGRQIDAVSLEMCRYKRTGEDFTTTAIHGIDCLSFLVGSGYKTVHCDYQSSPQRGNTNYYASGYFANGVHFDMRFVPDAGAVTERIAVYAQGYQLYCDLPVWSGTEYTEGFDCPGRLVAAGAQEKLADINGEEYSGCRDGFVLNGFYDEDKNILIALKEGNASPFPICTGHQSVEISELLRKGVKEYRWEDI